MEDTSFADAAYAAGLIAERLSSGNPEFRAAHEDAARKYVEAAKRVRDPVTRRAVALVGHAHAQKAAASQQPRLSQQKRPQTKLLSSSPPEDHATATSSSGTLCVGDLLALERRLHALGAKGLAKVAKKTQITKAAVTVDADHLVVAYVGVSSTPDDDDHEETKFSREESLARALKNLSDENARLRKTLDEVQAREALAEAIDDKLTAFKAAYQRKFDALKLALDDFRRRHPADQNPANAVADPFTPPKSYADLQTELRQLTDQLNTEREFSRKKDAVIERYEHWYRALKDSASKRKTSSSASGGGGSSSGGTTTPGGAAAVPGGSTPQPPPSPSPEGSIAPPAVGPAPRDENTFDDSPRLDRHPEPPTDDPR